MLCSTFSCNNLEYFYEVYDQNKRKQLLLISILLIKIMKTRKERQIMIIEPLFCSRHWIRNSTNYLTLPILCVNGCSVAQLRQTLCDPMDCSLPVSSDHGILQQECWSGLASRASSYPRNHTHVSCVSCIGRQVLCPMGHQSIPTLIPLATSNIPYNYLYLFYRLFTPLSSDKLPENRDIYSVYWYIPQAV